MTDDDALADWVRTARNYGSLVKYRHTIRGVNSRLDTLQAAVLRVKLRHLDRWNAERRALAAQYRALLNDVGLTLPQERSGVEHVYHLFVVRTPRRDAVLAALLGAGIGAGVHYPLPIHRQVAFGRGCIVPGPLTNSEGFSDQLLSLPMGPYMTASQVDTVVKEFRAALTIHGTVTV